jgi:hypothetical protein
MVEAPGVEPGSGNTPQQASTCLAPVKVIYRAGFSPGRETRDTILLQFRRRTTGVPESYPAKRRPLTEPAGAVRQDGSELAV